jgi:hypothetical protein
MASAWLDIAVDWEDPGGWSIAELLNIIIEAYNERVSVTVNNNGVRGSNTMPVLTVMALDTNTNSPPFVINHNSLNEINTRLEDLLTKSQNRTTALANDVEYWTVSAFLTEKGLPTDLIPVDFTCEIFDYRWITYWFYILNEMFLLHSYTWDVGISGTYKVNTNASSDDFTTAVASFIADAYGSGDGGQVFSGLYNYDLDTTPPPSVEDHDIRQRGLGSAIFRTYDSAAAFFEVALEVRVKLYVKDPVGYAMTWSYADGSVFDISSQFAWDVNGHKGTNIIIPDIVPQTDASTLGIPDDTLVSFIWSVGDNAFNRPTYIYSTDFNDENLISYTAIV